MKPEKGFQEARPLHLLFQPEDYGVRRAVVPMLMLHSSGIAIRKEPWSNEPIWKPPHKMVGGKDRALIDTLLPTVRELGIPESRLSSFVCLGEYTAYDNHGQLRLHFVGTVMHSSDRINATWANTSFIVESSKQVGRLDKSLFKTVYDALEMAYRKRIVPWTIQVPALAPA